KPRRCPAALSATSASIRRTARFSVSGSGMPRWSNPSDCSMRILRGLPSYPPDLRPSVTALGVFDGIHLAHAKVLATAVDRARALRVPAVVCPFAPNPAVVLRPGEAPAPIATLDENLERIAALGPDAALLIPFTPEFSRIEAETFVEDVLVGT